jgi:hypothetical protein
VSGRQARADHPKWEGLVGIFLWVGKLSGVVKFVLEI